VADGIVVFSTAGTLRESRKIARVLLTSRVAACVNIVPGMQSVYRWQGKIIMDRECLLIIKTTRRRFEAVRSTIQKAHSYTTPEIVSVAIVSGSREYLKWLQESVRGEDPL
jgi:periplasmic divalent cation tolerance protein